MSKLIQASSIAAAYLFSNKGSCKYEADVDAISSHNSLQKRKMLIITVRFSAPGIDFTDVLCYQPALRRIALTL